MRAVIQRVTRASVTVEGETVGAIGKGLVVLLGVGLEDTTEQCDHLCDKIIEMRIFEDEAGKMNLSLEQVGGQLLVISQFTLFADTRKGNRPSFISAARPELANTLYRRFIEKASARLGAAMVQEGKFGAMMEVELVNDGPVTISVDNSY